MDTARLQRKRATTATPGEGTWRKKYGFRYSWRKIEMAAEKEMDRVEWSVVSVAVGVSK